MARKVIEDSDGDESEPKSPHDSYNDVEQTKSSLPGIGHESESTDPSLFNNVFNEQQNAAREQARNYEITDSAEESEVANCVSFDQGYERVKSAEAQAEKSPWDVPSSPESSIKPRRSEKKKIQRSNTRTKMTRGLRRQLDDIGYISPDDEPTTRQTSNKKRRTQPETDTTDELVSTLPIESDGSPIAASKVHPSRQRGQHSTVRTSACPSPKDALQQCSTSIGSSGSATNVNTPREGYTPLAKPWSPGRPISSVSENLDMTQGGMLPPSGSTSIGIKVVDDGHANEEAEREDAPVQGESAAKRTTTRKPRGRPRKAEDATRISEENMVAAKVRKKRGRPKKSEVGSPSQGQQIERDSKPLATLQEQDTMETRDTLEKEATPQEHNTTETRDISEKENQLQPPGTPPKQSENTDGSVKKDMMNKKADVPRNSVGRQSSYRVGLSKRTKIASLLKVIRK
ncbi:hypothetical protein E4U41_000077 [Claviceps citrina]|nr:hypothetical protein E4U41_000077 [Claviceps citrina]